jgi:hypothetical protein
MAFENIRDLSVFPRWYGSDGMEGAARWLMKRAEGYGLSDIRLEEFPVDKGGRLTAICACGISAPGGIKCPSKFFRPFS